MADPSTGPVFLLGLDAALAAKLTAVAERAGHGVVVSDDTGPVTAADDADDHAADGAADVAAVVVGVGDESSAKAVRALRTRWPLALLVCVADTPDPIVWRLAQRTSDAVVNRGAAGRLLRTRLAERASGPRRHALYDAADAAGRLGLIATVTDTPVGEVGLYRVGGRFHAIAAACPHAGGALGEGELEGQVVTCPWHGSQFDVTTGERVRGPADDGVGCWPVVEESGQLWLVLP